MNIEDINKKIKELNKLKKLLSIPITEEYDTPEQIVFKKYLHIENVSRVATYMNDLGYRLGSSSRKYIANDISYIITSKDTIIKNNELRQIVINIFNRHKRGKRIF